MSRKFIDRTGERIGFVTITKLSEKKYLVPSTNKETLIWDYICDCGNTGSVFSSNLYKRRKEKRKFSCGCNAGNFRERLLLNKNGYNTCYRCKEIKPISEFGKNSSNKNGLQTSCKSCKSITDSLYRYNPIHREKNLNRKKEYYRKVKNTEKYIEYTNIRKSKRDYKNEYKRLRSDEIRKTKDIFRKLTCAAFARKNKSWVKKDTKTIDLLGADFFVVKEFIERQFIDGMNWDNYGTIWTIDHTIPLDAAGDDINNLKRLCYYENLSPMFSTENLEKGCVIPNICVLWENPVVPYKISEHIIVPRYDGVVGRYKSPTKIDEKFGKLTILSDADEIEIKSGKHKGQQIRAVLCQCDCGNQKIIRYNQLLKSKIRSCGCLQRDSITNHFINKELLFSDDEILELIEYTKLNKKGTKLTQDITQKYPGRTHKQVLYMIRSIRNNKLKKINKLINETI